LKEIPLVESVRNNGPTLQVMTKEGVSALEINRVLVERKIVVNHLQKVNRSLEDQFLKILEENND